LICGWRGEPSRKAKPWRFRSFYRIPICRWRGEIRKFIINIIIYPGKTPPARDFRVFFIEIPAAFLAGSLIFPLFFLGLACGALPPKKAGIVAYFFADMSLALGKGSFMALLALNVLSFLLFLKFVIFFFGIPGKTNCIHYFMRKLEARYGFLRSFCSFLLKRIASFIYLICGVSGERKEIFELLVWIFTEADICLLHW